MGALNIAHSSSCGQWTKHSGLKIHHVRSLVSNGMIKVKTVRTGSQGAGI